MGKFDFWVDGSLVRKLEQLSDFDNLAPEILNEAIPILERHVKAETLKHRRTSDLYNSIKAKKAYKNRYGWFATVRPTGKDRKGVRNMAKLAYAEYGTWKQAPTPILTKASNDAREEVEDKIQEKICDILEEM